jgi:hypothetical protein
MLGAKGDEKTIFIDQQPLPIRNNLWHFFKYLQSRKPHNTTRRLLWADAICIDQNNILERNHQVEFMSQIYLLAASVHIWLGLKSPIEVASQEGRCDTSFMMRWFPSTAHPDYWFSMVLSKQPESAEANGWQCNTSAPIPTGLASG